MVGTSIANEARCAEMATIISSMSGIIKTPQNIENKHNNKNPRKMYAYAYHIFVEHGIMAHIT